MSDVVVFAMTLLAALGCGLVAGIFFAFSSFVMKALCRLAPSEGIAAMQSINVAVLNLWFFTAFFGTAAVCVLALITALLRWNDPVAIYLLAGSVLYLIGTVLVTILFNVPRNEALASLKPTAANSAHDWANYVESWSAWNHVRTVASFAAAATYGIALGYSPA